MGMIIGPSGIPMLMVGYPTVSDKYNVAGGTLAGDSTVKFGDLVKFSTTKGYYEKASSLSAVTDAAGFVVATNVKLAEYHSNEVLTYPGEAFNLLVNGFIAIELDSNAVAADILANSSVYVILATGKLTTSSKAASGTVVVLPNTVFTGTYELHGTTLVAEIYVK